MNYMPPYTLATHSGPFHADDVMAYAILRMAFGLGSLPDDHRLVRTRDPAILAKADIVWDVGNEYDPHQARFDHHQINPPTRADGTPFSSAGLIWLDYGGRAVTAVLGLDYPTPLVTAVEADIDQTDIREIDLLDNGVVAPTGRLGLASIVDDLNAVWYEDEEDTAFLRATNLVEGILRRRIAVIAAQMRATDAVLLAQKAALQDGRILVLDRYMPWSHAVHAHALPTRFVLAPNRDGTWSVSTVPIEPGSYTSRLLLPSAWAGLRDTALAEASGVPDAVFVHRGRFVGGAKSRQGALALAERALAAS